YGTGGLVHVCPPVPQEDRHVVPQFRREVVALGGQAAECAVEDLPLCVGVVVRRDDVRLVRVQAGACCKQGLAEGVAGLDRAVALAVGAVLVVVLAFVDEVVGRVLAAEQLGGVVGVVRYGAEEAGHRVAAGRSVFAVGARGRGV